MIETTSTASRRIASAKPATHRTARLPPGPSACRQATAATTPIARGSAISTALVASSALAPCCARMAPAWPSLKARPQPRCSESPVDSDQHEAGKFRVAIPARVARAALALSSRRAASAGGSAEVAWPPRSRARTGRDQHEPRSTLAVNANQSSRELVFEQLNVRVDHQPNQLAKLHRRLPAQYALGF